MVLVVTMAFGCAGMTALASSEGVMTPVYAESLNAGRYKIQVTSSSSMFRIVECELVVSGSDMTAEMTLSGKGYEKLYMGTSQQAEAAAPADFILFRENADGKYTYTVPVEALDKEIDCAAFSIRKQRWYDRTLVFESGSLPPEVFAADSGDTASVSVILLIVLAGVGAAAVVVAAVVLVKKRK